MAKKEATEQITITMVAKATHRPLKVMRFSANDENRAKTFFDAAKPEKIPPGSVLVYRNPNTGEAMVKEHGKAKVEKAVVAPKEQDYEEKDHEYKEREHIDTILNRVKSGHHFKKNVKPTGGSKLVSKLKDLFKEEQENAKKNFSKDTKLEQTLSEAEEAFNMIFEGNSVQGPMGTWITPTLDQKFHVIVMNKETKKVIKVWDHPKLSSAGDFLVKKIKPRLKAGEVAVAIGADDKFIYFKADADAMAAKIVANKRAIEKALEDDKLQAAQDKERAMKKIVRGQDNKLIDKVKERIAQSIEGMIDDAPKPDDFDKDVMKLLTKIKTKKM